MTRTGLSPRLSQHRPEPLVEVYPDDAARLGLTDGGLAQVESAQGSSLYRVALTDGQRQGHLFVPMHWGDVLSAGGRTGRLPGKDRDPVSGQPGFKNVAARIEPYAPQWRAFLVSAERPAEPAATYWTCTRISRGWLTELAGDGEPDVAQLLPPGAQMEAEDRQRGTRRIAVVDDAGRLEAALFLTRDGTLPPRDWIAAQLAQHGASPLELLAGRAAAATPPAGPIVCACFDVGINTIVSAIAGKRLLTVEAVGTALRAGTNCGSCRPAIGRLLESGRKVANG